MFPVIQKVPKKLIQLIFDLTFLVNYWLDFFQWTLNQVLTFIHVCSIFLASFRSQFYISDCSIFSKRLFNVVPLNYQNQFYLQLQACFPINVRINSILPLKIFWKDRYWSSQWIWLLILRNFQQTLPTTCQSHIRIQLSPYLATGSLPSKSQPNCFFAVFLIPKFSFCSFPRSPESHNYPKTSKRFVSSEYSSSYSFLTTGWSFCTKSWIEILRFVQMCSSYFVSVLIQSSHLRFCKMIKRCSYHWFLSVINFGFLCNNRLDFFLQTVNGSVPLEAKIWVEKLV